MEWEITTVNYFSGLFCRRNSIVQYSQVGRGLDECAVPRPTCLAIGCVCIFNQTKHLSCRAMNYLFPIALLVQNRGAQALNMHIFRVSVED